MTVQHDRGLPFRSHAASGSRATQLAQLNMKHIGIRHRSRIPFLDDSKLTPRFPHPLASTRRPERAQDAPSSVN
jgi:hypothetical protein